MESIPPHKLVEPPRAAATAASRPDVPARDLAASSDLGHPAFAEPRRRWQLNRRTGSGVVAAVIAFAVKAKVLLLALAHIKVLVSVATMVISIAAYASIWGLPFAVGFVALLLVHELGHVGAIKAEGGKASLPMFIPFAGAFIAARSFGANAAAEARIGLAGPILGTFGAAVCYLVWKQTGHQIWQALAYWGFFLNLINLLPVLPLDGGRAMSAMSPLMWIVGYAVLAAVVLTVALSPIFVVFLVWGGFETVRRWRSWRSGEAAAYYKVAPQDRITVAVTYVVLAAVLALGMHATFFHAQFA